MRRGKPAKRAYRYCNFYTMNITFNRKTVESHLGIILQEKTTVTYLHYVRVCKHVRQSAYFVILSYLHWSANAHLYVVCIACILPNQRELLVIAQVLVTNSNDLLRCTYIIFGLCIKELLIMRILAINLYLTLPFSLATRYKKSIIRDSLLLLFL